MNVTMQTIQIGNKSCIELCQMRQRSSIIAARRWCFCIAYLYVVDVPFSVEIHISHSAGILCLWFSSMSVLSNFQRNVPYSRRLWMFWNCFIWITSGSSSNDGTKNVQFRSNAMTIQNKKKVVEWEEAKREKQIKCRRESESWMKCDVARKVFPLLVQRVEWMRRR